MGPAALFAKVKEAQSENDPEGCFEPGTAPGRERLLKADTEDRLQPIIRKRR